MTAKEHRGISTLSGFLWFTSPSALKVSLKLGGWQQSFSDSSKLSFLEKNFPTTTADARDRISCAKEEQRAAQMFPAFLILKAGRKAWVFCLPWLAVPGAQSMSSVRQDRFSRVKQSSSKVNIKSVDVSPALFLDTILWSSCNVVIPFIRFGALVGKTQEMDVTELLTLKAELAVILLNYGSVQAQQSQSK